MTNSSLSTNCFIPGIQEGEERYVREEIHRLIRRVAEKTSEDNGYGREFVIDSKDLKNFDKELRIEHSGDRVEDTQFIHRQTCIVNKSREDIQAPLRSTKTTKEDAKKQHTHKQADAAIKGSMQIDIAGQAKREMEEESKVVSISEIIDVPVPKGTELDYKEFHKDEYKHLLAKADKDFMFRVYLVNPETKGAAIVGGIAAGAAVGFSVGSIVGAWVGALIGLCVGGAAGTAAGVGIGYRLRKEIYLSVKEVFSFYKDENCKEHGRYMEYEVKYWYKHEKVVMKYKLAK